MNASPLAYALSYAERRGWAVFPVRRPLWTADGRARCSCPAGWDCPAIGKHPRVRWRTAEPATTDPDVIRRWWARWPTDNVAIATGDTSGLLVVDVDKDAGGWDTVGRLDEVHGWGWSTARVLTPTGGGHFYYAQTGGIPSSTHTSRTAGGEADPLGPGIDIRGDGGMVLAPPSQHCNGGYYVWQHQLVPGGDAHVAPLA